MTRRPALIVAALVLASVAIYWPVVTSDFVDLDDLAYIRENAVVARGLTTGGFAWALSARAFGTWQPLTWVSYMFDVELFGVSAPAHHTVNLTLHLANAVLLFALLRRLTGAEIRSALIAALFAVHPQHVESVAWIAERKDVLSLFCGLLALHGYRRYAARPGATNYLAVVIPFALSLAAKPMLVTLPLLMLILDRWPLSRWDPSDFPRWRLLAEKLPLLALSGLSSLATYGAQEFAGATTPLEGLSVGMRVANAFTAVATYLGKTLAPLRLAVIYPYPKSPPPLALVAVAALLLAALSAVAWCRRRTEPYLLTGWIWFLVALVPTIGFVQIGVHSMADRFMYLPHVGLFVAAVWWCGDQAARHGLTARQLTWPVVALVTLFGLLAHTQVYAWRNSETLFRHTLAVTTANWRVHTLLGKELERTGRATEAIDQYRQAVIIEPLDYESHLRLGNVLYARESYGDALRAYEAAVRLRPQSPEPLFNLGLAWVRIGNVPLAEECFRKALWLDPGDQKSRSMIIWIREGTTGGGRSTPASPREGTSQGASE